MDNNQRKKIVKVELLETFAEIIDTLYGSPMGASGQNHAPGQVPDPGATAGTSKFLREDGTWLDPLMEDPSNGHDYVEIGGIKWATMNIGANSVTDYGLYFQWGDTSGYTASQVGSGSGQKYFGWADYKFSNNGGSSASDMTKYNSTDRKTVLDLEDDAARVNWGGEWRMPTTAEYAALGAAVNSDWTSSYNDSGIAGLVLTDKTDSSKKLFFPACGYCNNGSVNNVGSNGYYWSGSLHSNVVRAYYLDFSSGSVSWQSIYSRYLGFAVRGVLDGPSTPQPKVVLKSEVGAANGVASLDNSGKVPSSQLPDIVGPTVNKTWAELKAMRDGGTLVPGQWYRITDYTCTTTQENTQSAGHVFDIIVRADATNKLNENAYAALHSGDTYFANSKLEAWQLKYCIDNDTTHFAWADSTNGKGVIYYMKDESNNECPYDFKNIQFKRYQLKNQNSLHLADYPMGESDYSAATQTAFNIWKAKLGNAMNANNAAFYYTRGTYPNGYVVNGSEIYDYNSDYGSYDNGNLIFDDGSDGNYVSVAYICDYFDVIAEVVNTTGEWLYTFSKKATTAATATDASMDTNCYENSIKGYFNSGVQNLNDTIFIVIGNSITAYANSFDINCYNNTFGNSCNRNTFGNGCYSNTFVNSCNRNTFGNSCGSNTFGNECYSNSFGNNCYSNTFGNYCYSNTFVNSCNRNTFGNSCGSNTFGNECYSNSFGNNCYSNTFGNYCYSNTFGNSCGSNTFGNYFQYNTFGNYCYSNTFGNSCQYITFSKDYCYYNIVENGNQRITLTSTQTTSGSNLLRNIKICQGVNNTTTTKTISHNTVNDTFQTEYKPANSQVISV